MLQVERVCPEMQRIAGNERGEYRIAKEEFFGKPEEHFFLTGLIVEDTEAELGWQRLP